MLVTAISMPINPADKVAKIRASAGLSRLTQQRRAELPHPGKGGSRGYPVFVREMELQRKEDGLPPAIASRWSISRWSMCLDPYRMTGNSDQSKLVGPDQMLLVIGITISPSASEDEYATFIYNQGGRIYSRVDISRHLDGMKIARKRALTEAY